MTSLLLFLFLFTACSDDFLSADSPYFQNNPPQATQGKLKILAIGNSYTDDGTAYISEITHGLGIPDSCYAVYSITRGSTDLNYWYNAYKSLQDTLTARHIAGCSTLSCQKGTLADLLKQEWDIVVLQQVSNLAIDYKKYNPALRRLITAIHSTCQNSSVTIAWQLIPAYGYNSPNNKKLRGDSRWKKIAVATQQMQSHDGIDLIIPTGTAIQIARHTRLENDMDLTRDHTHLCFGVGRYIAACTWVQTLLCPIFNRNILHCQASHMISQQELENKDDGFVPSSCLPVTEENRSECLRCVTEACRHPFSLQDGTE